MSLSRIGVVGLAALLGVAAPAASAQTREHRAVGVVQTGPNDRCGSPVWTLALLASGPESHGTFLGKKDDSAFASGALPLVSSDCTSPAQPDAVLATTYDDAFGTERGWLAPDPELENRSLRSVPVPSGNDVRAVLPVAGALPPNPLPPTVAEPDDPITLESWLAAAGDLEIVCDDGAGTATLAAEMQGLVPNGVYTMWGQWETTTPSLLAAPIGGLPNTIVADAGGRAAYCRALAFCPLDLAPDGSELQFLSLVFHADGTTYGAVPYEAFTTRVFVGLGGGPFTSSIPGGIVSFDQLGFRVHASGGPGPAPDPPILCNDPPVAVNDEASVEPGGTVVVEVLANDTDPDGALQPFTVAIAKSPAHASAFGVDPESGQVTYTHDGSATTSDFLTYTVADDAGEVSGEATVAVNIPEPGVLQALLPGLATLLALARRHRPGGGHLCGSRPPASSQRPTTSSASRGL